MRDVSVTAETRFTHETSAAVSGLPLPGHSGGGWRPIVAIGAFAMAGNTPLVVQPMVVGALVDSRGLSPAEAGAVASLELWAMTLTMLALIAMPNRVPRHWLAYGALALIVGANVSSSLVTTMPFIAAARVVSGIGAAAALNVYLSMVASRAVPENAFATVNAVSISYSGLLVLVAPLLLSFAGLFGLLGAVAVLTALAFPLATIARDAAASPVVVRRGTRFPWRVVPLLSMMLLLYAGHGAIWAYQERIGVAAGLSVEEIGRWLGLSMLIFGVAGSLLARTLALRIGRVWPQVLSLGVSVLAVLLLVEGTGEYAYATASALIAFSWFYGLPYQMGLLALADPRGRAAMAGLMMSTGGMALGPTVGAGLVREFDLSAVGMFAGVCYLLALGLATLAAWRASVDAAS